MKPGDLVKMILEVESLDVDKSGMVLPNLMPATSCGW